MKRFFFIYLFIFIFDIFFPSPFKDIKNFFLIFSLILILFVILSFKEYFQFFLKHKFLLGTLGSILIFNLLFHGFYFCKLSIFKNLIFISLLYLSFSFLFSREKDDGKVKFRSAFEKIWALVVMVEFFVSFVQFFNPFFLSSLYLTKGTIKQVLWEKISFGTFPHPNFLGTFMGISSIFFFFKLSEGVKYKVIFFLSILALLLSHSRGAIFSTLFLLLILYLKKFFTNKYRNILIFSVALLFLLEILIFLFFNGYYLKKRILCFGENIISNVQCGNFNSNKELRKFFDINGDGNLDLMDEIFVVNLSELNKCDFVKYQKWHNDLLKRIEKNIFFLFKFEDISSLGRLLIVKSCISMIKDNLFLGVGIGNYVCEIKKYTLVPQFYAFNKYHPHSFYLLILCELGIFMGSGIIVLFFYLLFKNYKYSSYFFIILYLAYHSFFDITFYAEGTRIILPFALYMTFSTSKSHDSF